MSKKVLVMQFINDLNRGGAEILLLNICKGIKQRYANFEFKVAIFRDKRYLESEFNEAGVEVIYLKADQVHWIRKIKLSFQILKKYKPDIVHSHLLLSDRYSLIAAFLAGIKIRFCTAHNMELKRDWRDALTRIVTSIIAHKIIVVSDSVRKFCIENNLYPAKKLIRIYNAPGFEAKATQPKKWKGPSEKITMVNIGRLNEQKGQIYLIKAMEKLSHCNVHLDIYGEGDLKKDLQREIDRLNLNNVQLKGNSNKIEKILKTVDIFISSSLWEGLPMAAVEAMSMGVPSILSSILPHEELLDGLKGYPLLVPTANEEEIALKVKLLLNSAELYRKCSEIVLAQSRRFTLETMINNYYKLYSTNQLTGQGT